MKNKWYLKILSLIILILSIWTCNNNPVASNIENNSNSQKNDTIAESKFIKDTIGINKDTLKINFPEFNLFLPNIYCYEEDTQKYKDSTEIVIDFLSTFDSQKVILSYNKHLIDKIEVNEFYKTSLSISNEGPHIDLTEWKGNNSGWIKVKRTGELEFITKIISEESRGAFPKFTKKELIKYLKQNKEDYWIKVIEHPYDGNWRDTYWIGIGIRKLKFDIKFLNGKTITKYLIVRIPMGC